MSDDNGPVKSTRRPSARGYAVTLVVGMPAATGVVVGLARPWIAASAIQPGLPDLETTVTGAEVAPLAGALGFVMLAAFGAVVATRGVIRRALGVLIVVCAVVVAVSTLVLPDGTDQVETGLSAIGWAGGPYETSTRPWRWVTLAAAVLCAVAGAAIAGVGHRWATMGSRYDAPTSKEGSAPSAGSVAGEDMSEADVWREIDEGRDPTQQS